MSARGLPRWSVRARILASMLVVTAVGMALAGAVTFLVQRERTLEEMDARLLGSIETARIIVSGDAPTTATDGTVGQGQVFPTVRAALQGILESDVPAHDESALGIIDGVASYVPGVEVDIHLENEDAFVSRIVEEVDDGSVRQGTAVVAGTNVRYIASPIEVAGDPEQGIYLVTLNSDEELDELVSAFSTYALVALLALLVTGLVGWFVAGTLLRPIRRLRAAASRITASDRNERIIVEGRDDVSELTVTVNDMLDRLDSAMNSQHQLLDDVRHELKTPLTILRGHLELVDSSKVDDVEATRALALDELDRMAALVDDIDTWASVQSSTPNLEEVDVAAFTDSVFAKASALPDHSWELSGRATGVARLDAHRVTQGWLQLVDNAAKYSPTGSTIVLGSLVTNGAVEFWVQDAGPGIPAGSEDRIFERFGRIDAGRGIHGSGLGLPIVRSIAHAHGGRVSLASSDAGSRFGIVIPLTEGPQ
ncbi:HAMP domain-containing histidine kinase [Glaciihabitans arcticus]|uniref:histidine kinase n=1 Tax=Glaciihabitans arcticus TaxID=2668039 RepID=A0A4Q9GQC0_9MICO|nr:HAMP domain-containing sensor histidine kinase [Glaciihabitans arcticus]TBN57056.1 HAMP domain-containing histidine kinase [Glaciihabitans arcticus]